jgi:HK97 family phage major capsid protein
VLEEVSQLLSVVDFQSGVPTKGSYVTLTGRPTLQPKRASTDTSLTQSDPAFGTFDWDTEEAGFSFPVDNLMFELSPIDLGSRLVPLCRDAFIQGLCDWLINADGTATYNSVSGILADTVNVVRMAGGSFGDLSNDDLRKVQRAVLTRARARGVFLTGPYALDVLEGIDRSGKVPVLRESGDGYTIMGKTHVEDEGMPDETDSGADKAFLGFGDPKTWAVVLAAKGLNIAFDASVGFRNNVTWYRALGHVDIVRKPGNTWALLKTKAA